jgi:hypothetical protein
LQPSGRCKNKLRTGESRYNAPLQLAIMTKTKVSQRKRLKKKVAAAANGMPKSKRHVPNKTREQILKDETKVIWVPAPSKRSSGIKAADAVGGPHRTSKLCKACGHKIPPGQFVSHKCEGITATVVRVRKRSTLPGRRPFVKVKSGFTGKLSDISWGWW